MHEVKGKISGCTDYFKVMEHIEQSEAYTSQVHADCGFKAVDLYKESDVGQPASEAVYVIVAAEPGTPVGKGPLVMLAPPGTRVIPVKKLKFCGHCVQTFKSDVNGAKNIFARKFCAIDGVAPMRFQLEGPGPEPMSEERRNYLKWCFNENKRA